MLHVVLWWAARRTVWRGCLLRLVRNVELCYWMCHYCKWTVSQYVNLLHPYTSHTILYRTHHHIHHYTLHTAAYTYYTLPYTPHTTTYTTIHHYMHLLHTITHYPLHYTTHCAGGSRSRSLGTFSTKRFWTSTPSTSSRYSVVCSV